MKKCKNGGSSTPKPSAKSNASVKKAGTPSYKKGGSTKKC